MISMTKKKLISIKIPQDQINNLVTEIKNSIDFHILSKSKSEYEILRAQYDESLIIIYSSGSITYHENKKIDGMILKYTFNKQKKEKKKSVDKKIRVHLTKEQLNAFESKLELFAVKEGPKNIGEKATFRYNGSIIILYQKGTVYSPKSHINFEQSLLEVITEIPSYTNFELMIGQDEVGKGEIFGPMVVSSVALNQNQIIKLQIEGIRDSKDVDKKDIEKLADVIKKNSVVWRTKHAGTEIFNEKYEEFKNEDKTINDFLAWMHSIALEELLKELDKKKVGNQKLLLIIDEFDRIKTDERIAKKIKDRRIEIIQTPKAELSSIAVAAASIIAKNRRNELLEEIQNEIGFELSIENINDLLLHPKASKAMKLSYVKSAQKSGVLPVPITTIRGLEVDKLLTEIINRSDLECESIEFKGKFPDQAWKIGSLITAFANTIGGYIFFGISDKEKKLIGLENVQKVEERIQGIRPKFDPKPLIKFTKLVNSVKKNFLRVEISQSKDEAISFDGRYYIRIGSTTKVVSPSEMNELWKTRKGKMSYYI